MTERTLTLEEARAGRIAVLRAVWLPVIIEQIAQEKAQAQKEREHEAQHGLHASGALPEMRCGDVDGHPSLP
jgi:hypothetical protein